MSSSVCVVCGEKLGVPYKDGEDSSNDPTYEPPLPTLPPPVQGKRVTGERPDIDIA